MEEHLIVPTPDDWARESKRLERLLDMRTERQLRRRLERTQNELIMRDYTRSPTINELIAESRRLDYRIKHTRKKYAIKDSQTYTFNSSDQTIQKTGRKILIPFDDQECCICLEEYTNKIKLRVFLCNHHMHLSCSSKWLTSHNTCPICRKDISM